MINTGLCEVRWLTFRAVHGAKHCLSAGSPDDLRCRTNLLRRLLRRCPTWTRGHLLLGKTERLHAELLPPGAGRERCLAAVRCSALAVLQLLGERNPGSRRPAGSSGAAGQAAALLGEIAPQDRD